MQIYYYIEVTAETNSGWWCFPKVGFVHIAQINPGLISSFGEPPHYFGGSQCYIYERTRRFTHKRSTNINQLVFEHQRVTYRVRGEYSVYFIYRGLPAFSQARSA